MYVEQLFTGCLAEMAYYIESNGEAAIIDPLRETTPYIEKAVERGAKIKYVFLTHFHADFVSGHLDLAQKVGATIVFGPNATTVFEIHSGKDNEEFQLGAIRLKLLHTPGHTMESSSYLLVDEQGNTPYIFTGDALFIGDVGRPDLAVKSDLTQTDLAGHLFDSLRNKIMPLPNDTIVYPAHGAGSACGKNMSKETFDTLGNQKKTNYALRADMTKAEFIKEVTTGLTNPPQYFPKNVGMNKGINKSYDTILQEGLKSLTVAEFEELRKEKKALVLDVRSTDAFIQEHITDSIFIGLDGSFAPWAGALISKLETPILLIAPEGREEEAVTRLSRVGLDHTLGFLKGGLTAWKEENLSTSSVLSISPEAFAAQLKADDYIVDVRKPKEFETGHIKHANVQLVPLDNIQEDYTTITNQKCYLHCAGGYRSVIAISLMKQQGYHDLVNVEGGFRVLEQFENIETIKAGCSASA